MENILLDGKRSDFLVMMQEMTKNTSRNDELLERDDLLYDCTRGENQVENTLFV